MRPKLLLLTDPRSHGQRQPGLASREPARSHRAKRPMPAVLHGARGVPQLPLLRLDGEGGDVPA